MRTSFLRSAQCAFLISVLSGVSLGVASAQGVPTPWVSPDDYFNMGSQLLADLNGLKCYDEEKSREAARWRLSVRPLFPGRPSMAQMSSAVGRALDRVQGLPPCVKTVQRPLRLPAQAPSPTPRTPQTLGEFVQDSWSVANRITLGEFNGFYVGGRVGGQRAENGWTTRDLVSINIVDPLEAGAVHANPTDTGFIGGVFVGYNVLLPNNFVAGLEIGVDIGGGESTIHGIPGIGAFLPGAVGQGDRITIDNKWAASITGNLGILVTPQVHTYGLFGWAWQRADAAFACDDIVGFCSAGPVEPAFQSSQSVTLNGPVIGGGIELAAGGGWVGRLEYRYISLRDQHVNLGNPATRSVGATFDQDSQTVTFGLRYAFGAPPPPPPP